MICKYCKTFHLSDLWDFFVISIIEIKCHQSLSQFLNFHNDRKVHEIINRSLTILISKDYLERKAALPADFIVY